MARSYKARNGRLIARTGGGQFRSTTPQDFGIGGVCPVCRHLLLQHYDGDPRDDSPNPRKFRYRCFTCEPRTAEELKLIADIEKAKPKVKTMGDWLAEIAEQEEHRQQ